MFTASISQIVSESMPPESKFVPERDMPDLSGKVVIVTGVASRSSTYCACG